MGIVKMGTSMKKNHGIYHFFLLCTLLISACTKSPNYSQVKLISPDFAIQTLEKENLSFEIDPDCESQMAKALCVSESEELEYDENCSVEKVSKEQLEALKRIVNELPSFHKKVMCNLSHIQIQDKIYSIAYATVVRNTDKKVLGNMIGVRSEVLSGSSNQKDLLSWKEQLNFGLSDPKDPERKVSARGIYVSESLPKEYSTYLPTIIHELNHLIDFMNSANDIDFSNCTDDPNERHISYCRVPETSFSRLSWDELSPIFIQFPEDTEDDLNKVQFPNPTWVEQWPLVGKLCFYNCKETQSVDSISSVYAELEKSNFTTSYSTQSEMEDFAEAATYYALYQVGIPFHYKIFNAEGQVYFDGYEHFLSDPVKTKREWLNDFFRRDLSYRVQ